MRCVHGNDGSRCSQCAGAVPTRVEVRDGVIYVDGEKKRTLEEVNRARYVEENESSRPSRFRTCGRCRKPGHNVATCPEPDGVARPIEVLRDDEN